MYNKFVIMIFFLALCCVTFVKSFAGTVRQDNRFWDIKVFETKNKNQASLFVYWTKNYQEAIGHDAVWTWAHHGDTAITFTHNIDDADLVIYVTDNKSEAGWKKAHILRGKLSA